MTNAAGSSEEEVFELLRRPTLWTTGSAHVAAAAARLDENRAAADAALARLLAADEAEWPLCFDVGDHSLRTLTFTRCLVAAAKAARDENPRRALGLTTIAIDVAGRVASDPHETQTVLVRGVTGDAWREHAECLAQLGRLEEALQAVARAQLELEAYASSAYELARLALTKANVLFQLRRGIEAIFEVRHAQTVFHEFDEAEQKVKARALEAAILYQAGRTREALDLWTQTASSAAAEGKPEILAMLLLNCGTCLRDIGEHQKARSTLEAARSIYASIGKDVNVVIAEKALATNLVAEGNLVLGLKELCRVADRFTKMGLLPRSALARLEVVEVLLATDDRTRALDIARQLVDDFSNAGMTAMATAALAYLREAIQTNAARPAHAKHVRRYLEDVQRKPQLLFAPLPAEGAPPR